RRTGSSPTRSTPSPRDPDPDRESAGGAGGDRGLDRVPVTGARGVPLTGKGLFPARVARASFTSVTLDQTQRAAAAESLWAADRDRAPIEPLTQEFPGIDVVD